MALKSKSESKRISIPHEPNEWMELRQPSAGDLRDLKDLDDYDYNLGMMSKMVTAWSYGPEVTLALLGDLDAQTYSWLSGILPEYMGLRAPDEKKDSNGNSPDGPEPGADDSPQSSDT